jgi:hypothetical protein
MIEAMIAGIRNPHKLRWPTGEPRTPCSTILPKNALPHLSAERNGVAFGSLAPEVRGGTTICPTGGRHGQD